jgi:hypothetical protein
LLLFGGAIQLADEVKARRERRRARSDWMAVERGISVSSAVMSFEHQGLAFNLLNTPGHQDFSAQGECNRPLSSCVVSYEGEITRSQASLLKRRGAVVAPAGGLHPPDALVLGGGTCRRRSRRCYRPRESRSTMWLP